jgi:hypothetical protein
MNKQELIQELENKTFVKKLTKLEDTGSASQDLKLYAQHYIESDGNVAKETKAHIYVLDEGLATEEAYFKDREPELSVQTTHPLVKKYQSTINQYNGKVIDKGEDFIVLSGYIDGSTVDKDDKSKTVKLPKTWFAQELNGELNVKEIK